MRDPTVNRAVNYRNTVAKEEKAMNHKFLLSVIGGGVILKHEKIHSVFRCRCVLELGNGVGNLC